MDNSGMYGTVQPMGATEPQNMASALRAAQTQPTTNDTYLPNLKNQMYQEFPFTKKYNANIIMGTGEGHAETWPRMEEGTPEYPRPEAFGQAGPQGQVGIEIRDDNMTPFDIGLEHLHVDPVAHKTREYIKSSLSPAQFDAMRNEYRDYDMSMGLDMRPDDAMNNGVDSLMRGYLGQAPQSVNNAMNYSPTQKAMLDSLNNYMRTNQE